MKRFLFCVLGAIAFLFGSVAWSAEVTDTKPVEGLHEHVPSVFVLTHAKITLEPGRTLDDASMVIRDGAIVAVGPNIEPPNDAKVYDLTGKSIYPGLIDAFAETNASLPEGGAKHWNSLITPQLDLASQYRIDSSAQEKLRRQGVVARLVAPSNGILKGQSLLIGTASEPSRLAILKSNVAQQLRLSVPRGRGRDSYPNSPMGGVALARQTFLDAQWYQQAWKTYHANRGLPRPERNDALAALGASLDSEQRFIIDSSNEIFLLRADAFAREFSLRAIIRGSGQEYQRLDAVQASGRSLIIPVNFPKPPKVDSPELARAVEVRELMHWDLAPENPARLDAAGIQFAFAAHGLDDIGEFLAHVRIAVKRGLSKDSALRSMTVNPAEMFGAADRLGSLGVGRPASLIVTDGDLFEKSTRILETWVDGRRYEIAKPQPADLRGEWKFAVKRSDKSTLDLKVKVNGKPDKLSGIVFTDSESGKPIEIKFDSLLLRDRMLTGRFTGKAFDRPGMIQFSAVLEPSSDDEIELEGSIVWPDGVTDRLDATRVAKLDSMGKAEVAEGTDKPESDDAKPKAAAESTFVTAVNYPLGAYGRTSPPVQPKHVVIKNATIWTSGKLGVLNDASILITHGKISSIGASIEIPSDALVIDAEGKHLSPGIIDCHSHMATDGGVNEGTQAITAEVRISDFIDCDDIDIYRQLAGGVTTVNVLHGSANPIGGQNQVLQLKWGELFDAMRFSKAPAGVKFALGENAKRSNTSDGPSDRYPQSRMGVDQIIRDAFHSAKEYQQQWDRWTRLHEGLPPRRDLELEALAQVLRGERWVHCHSYRQDEILALLRTCEEFGIKIATFQHILEGYKVADAMARHGAMGSAFSDWWAYKMEAYDAIPYNGVIMHRSGVVVSFNSDDQELARHLNHEAAKAVRYGKLEAEEALKFVTLNPARQLRIDEYVGSLEVGKQADIVLWSGPPLSLLSRCEQTWIDGRKYFDIQEDLETRESAHRTRTQLVQKVLTSGQTPKKASESEKPEEELWPRVDIYCRSRSGE
ncbi:MAG: amidohydrolase family protein [Pirellulaceae bacterium]|nr:amidohydrolase family protein [Pirellulaceae bacterium]